MKVAILIQDSGDGSSNLVWLKNIELAKTLCDSDDHCETFGCNDGSPTIIEVPYGWEPLYGFDDEFWKEEV